MGALYPIPKQMLNEERPFQRTEILEYRTERDLLGCLLDSQLQTPNTVTCNISETVLGFLNQMRSRGQNVVQESLYCIYTVHPPAYTLPYPTSEICNAS